MNDDRNFNVKIKDGYKIEVVADVIKKLGIKVNKILPAIGVIAVSSSLKTASDVLQKVDGVLAVEAGVDFHV